MHEPPAKTPAQTPPADRPKRSSWRARVLWSLALLGAAAFAAWQVAVFAMNRPLTPAPRPADFGQQRPTSVPSDSVLPSLADPLAVEGLKTVRSEPPLTPPEGAKRITAVGRPDTGRDGWVWLIWIYRTDADPDSMLAYARSVAGSAGFQEQPVRDRKQRLLFTRDGEITHVAVQPASDGGTRLSITTQRVGRDGDF